MKSSSSRLDGSRSCRPKTRSPGENPARPASIEFCKRKVNHLIDLSLRRRSFQTARFLECHFEQGSMSLNDRILPWRFQLSHHGQGTPGLAQVLKICTKFGTLVHDQNFRSVKVFEPELSQCGRGLRSCHVLPACALVVTCPMTDDVRYSNWFS